MREFTRTTGAVAALLILWAGTLCAQHSYSEEHMGLLHTIATDAGEYCMIGTVAISYTVTNVTAEPIVLELGEGGHPIFHYVFDPEMFLVYAEPSAGLPVTWTDTLDPDESYFLGSEWDMIDYGDWPWFPIDEPGTYTVQGRLGAFWPEGIGLEVNLPIEILDCSAGVEELEGSWSRIKALYH
jgi:hypothetical protein